MTFYGKVFSVESEENYDQFVKSMGLPENITENLIEYKPKRKLVKDGDSYIFTIYSKSGEKVYPCKSGVEYSDTFRDLPVKVTVIAEGDNKFIQKIKFDMGLVITIKKEYSEDKLIEVITNNLWEGVARRIHKAE